MDAGHYCRPGAGQHWESAGPECLSTASVNVENIDKPSFTPHSLSRVARACRAWARRAPAPCSGAAAGRWAAGPGAALPGTRSFREC